MTYATYLQGSYANATNIRGNSDVDLVVQSDAVSYSNLTKEEKRKRGLNPGRFGFKEFRAEVLAALLNHYGTNAVTVGDKSLKVAAGSGRLPADVVPCIKYKEYKEGQLYAEGMTFWSQAGKQVKNFPKLHIQNGSNKNAKARTTGWYKPTVRVFKNARESIIAGDENARKRVPSYFVECLIYNAPDACFGGTYQDTYQAVLMDLLGRMQTDPGKLICQNGRRWLFGPDGTKWNKPDAEYFLQALKSLWDRWYS